MALARSSRGRVVLRDAGVTLFVARDGLVTEGRFYMEPVEADGGDIEAAVRWCTRDADAWAVTVGALRAIIESRSITAPQAQPSVVYVDPLRSTWMASRASCGHTHDYDGPRLAASEAELAGGEGESEEQLAQAMNARRRLRA